MSKSFLKQLKRSIVSSKGRFLSLMVITAIGVAMYAGIHGTTPTMQNSAEHYFETQNMHDIQIFSPTGFIESDIQKIEALFDQPIDIELTHIFDAYVRFDDIQLVSKAQTFKTMNLPYLVEGQMPTSDDQCVVEDGYEHLIGREVELASLFNTGTCKVVGTIRSTSFFGKLYHGPNRLGVGKTDLFIFVSENLAFEMGVFNHPMYDMMPIYTQMLIRFDDLLGVSTFTDTYLTRVNAYAQTIKEENPDLIVLTRRDNPSINAYEQDARKIEEIGAIFPIVFFLVATLVSLTTMTRMIEKERLQMGILKAIGYTTLSVSLLYILYALIATVIGAILGLLIGFNTVPIAVLYAYRKIYLIPKMIIVYDIEVAIVAISIVLILVVGATIFTSIQTAYKQPAQLMRPKSPPAGKRIFLERLPFIWTRMRFTSKVTARNILRYKKRFFMSVFGIMGCAMLLAVGLGVNSSIDPIRDRQFNTIYKYDYLVNTVSLPSAYIDMHESMLLDIEGVDQVKSAYRQEVSIVGDRVDTVQLFVMDMNDTSWIYLQDENLNDIKNENVVLTYKIAETLGLQVGEAFSIELDGQIVELKVGAISQFYFEHYLFIDTKYFNELGFDINVNSFMVKTEASDLENQTEKIVAFDWVQSILIKEDVNQAIANSMSGMYYVIGIMVLFAGILIIVVVYNLNIINIEERRRELATIKVLGFYDREVASYVYKENIILTLIGIIVGLVLARPLHHYIITQAELPSLLFIRYLRASDYVLAFIVTFIFAMIVNLLMNRLLRDIDMIESLKSVE